VSYRETVNKFNKKILKWYVAIPLGFVAYMISNALGGAYTLAGEVVGVFNVLIFVGVVTGIMDLFRAFNGKK